MRQEYILNRVECCMKCGMVVPKGELKNHVCPLIKKQATWMEKNKLAKKEKEAALNSKPAKKNELSDKQVKDLKKIATDLGIENCMQMQKPQLIESIKIAKLKIEDDSKE